MRDAIVKDDMQYVRAAKMGSKAVKGKNDLMRDAVVKMDTMRDAIVKDLMRDAVVKDLIRDAIVKDDMQ